MRRRDVLRSTAGLAVGAAGVSAAAGSTSASTIGALYEGLKCISDTTWETAPEDYPVVDLRSDSAAETGDWPDDPDELTVFVHGLGGDLDGAWRDQAYTFETAAERNGWEPTQVAARYTTLGDSLDWDVAVELAKTAARRLAAWLREYDSDASTSSYNVVAHSLGGHVTGTLLDELDGGVEIDNVALLAPAIPSDSVCEDDGEYAAAIQASAGSVHNYRSSNDDVVCDLYSSRLLGAGTDGLGCRSPDCGSGWGWYRDEGSTPSNFHDHDVSRTVTKHCNYPRPGEGCVSDVVADFGKGDGSGDDESDDNSDDDGWGWGW